MLMLMTRRERREKRKRKAGRVVWTAAGEVRVAAVVAAVWASKMMMTTREGG